MSYNLKTLREADIKGKKILLRVAYDITLQEQNGKMIVPDDTRIRATIPTIEYLLEQGCSIALLSWLRRPGGKVVEEMRMKPVADKLAELLGQPVKSLPDCAGPDVEKEIHNLKPGEIVMLENVRFHPEEEAGDQNFAKQLVKGFDLIVYDAFAQAHRVHASTTRIVQEIPAVAGLLFQKEIEILSGLLDSPQHPFVALMGGAKISDRVGVMENLIKKADKILIGGALANTFFKAQGLSIGQSLIEDVFVDKARGEKRDYVELCRKLIASAGDKFEFPVDMLAAEMPESQDIRVINLDKGEVVPESWSFYDIGPRTVENFSKTLKAAKMIFANGPMGLFEIEAFAGGTKQLAEAMIASGATTVLGGGDTESIVERYGWQGKFTHVSTGGGASLEFLAGKEFPVMKYLVK